MPSLKSVLLFFKWDQEFLLYPGEWDSVSWRVETATVNEGMMLRGGGKGSVQGRGERVLGEKMYLVTQNVFLVFKVSSKYL